MRACRTASTSLLLWTTSQRAGGGRRDDRFRLGKAEACARPSSTAPARPDQQPEGHRPRRSLLAESTTRSTSAADGYGVGDNPSVSANLDLVRSIFADWERGDYRSGEWAHPEIEVVFADGPSPGRWT